MEDGGWGQRNSEIRSAKPEAILEGQSSEIRNDAVMRGFNLSAFGIYDIVSSFELRILCFYIEICGQRETGAI